MKGKRLFLFLTLLTLFMTPIFAAQTLLDKFDTEWEAVGYGFTELFTGENKAEATHILALALLNVPEFYLDSPSQALLFVVGPMILLTIIIFEGIQLQSVVNISPKSSMAIAFIVAVMSTMTGGTGYIIRYMAAGVGLYIAAIAAIVAIAGAEFFREWSSGRGIKLGKILKWSFAAIAGVSIVNILPYEMPLGILIGTVVSAAIIKSDVLLSKPKNKKPFNRSINIKGEKTEFEVLERRKRDVEQKEKETSDKMSNEQDEGVKKAEQRELKDLRREEQAITEEEIKNIQENIRNTKVEIMNLKRDRNQIKVDMKDLKRQMKSNSNNNDIVRSLANEYKSKHEELKEIEQQIHDGRKFIHQSKKLMKKAKH